MDPREARAEEAEPHWVSELLQVEWSLPVGGDPSHVPMDLYRAAPEKGQQGERASHRLPVSLGGRCCPLYITEG